MHDAFIDSFYFKENDFRSDEKSLSWRCDPVYSLRIHYQGTLYNHQELKQQLDLNENIDDATLIMIGYHKWGNALFTKLNGIFSLALYHQKKELLILAKDHASISPLYYYHDSEKFIFSSSLKCLSNSKHYSKKLNFNALSNYFTYGYIMQPNSIYEGCYKVKSGHFLELNLRTKKIDETKYWDLGMCYDTPKLTLTEEEIKHKAKSLLQDSIRRRVAHYSTYGASLSGGYDSASIVALLQEQATHKIKTFTIGFEDATINEAPHAKKIAAHLGTEHIEHYFSAKDALRIIPKLSEIFDEPFYDNGSIPTTLLSEIAKAQGIDTIFAGDGGDEVFATANDIDEFDAILAQPQSIRNGLFELLNVINPSSLPWLKSYNNFPTKYYKFIHMLRAKNIPEMVKIKMTLFHPFEIKELLQSDAVSFKSIFDEIYFGSYAQSVDKVIGSYFKTFMTDGELIKTTQAFKYQNLALREPYLDKSLIAFMARVPSDIKIKNGIKKNILKQITHDYIPISLMDRPKQGFSVPFSAWMKGELRELLLETLSVENLKKDAILNVDYVQEIKNQFLNGKEEYKYKLWSILLYQLWYEKNMR